MWYGRGDREQDLKDGKDNKRSVHSEPHIERLWSISGSESLISKHKFNAAGISFRDKSGYVGTTCKRKVS